MNGADTPVDVGLDFLDGGAIAILSLDDPLHGNAMSPEMGDAFRRRVEELSGAPGLRAAIVRGAGKTFSVGGYRDMLQMLAGDLSEDERREFMLGFYDRWLALLDIPVPVIAAIEGECIGVAPVFAVASDLSLADETAKLQITFTNLGLYPGMGLSYLVPRAVGPLRTGSLLLAGEPCSGAAAGVAGLVTRATAAGRVHEEALALARRIAENVAGTTATLTRNLRVTREELQPVLERDAVHQAESYGTEEFRERIARYLPDTYDASETSSRVSSTRERISSFE